MHCKAQGDYLEELPTGRSRKLEDEAIGVRGSLCTVGSIKVRGKSPRNKASPFKVSAVDAEDMPLASESRTPAERGTSIRPQEGNLQI
jgi:hypothetical protein